MRSLSGKRVCFATVEGKRNPTALAIARLRAFKVAQTAAFFPSRYRIFASLSGKLGILLFYAK